MVLSNYTTNFSHPGGGTMQNITIKLYNKSVSPWRWKNIECYCQIIQQNSSTLMVEKCKMLLSNIQQVSLTMAVEKCKMLLSNYTTSLPHPGGGKI